MDFTDMNTYGTGNGEGDNLMMNSSALDIKLANILNSLSQHNHGQHSGEHVHFQEQDALVNNGANIPLSASAGLSTIDASVLPLSFDADAIHSANEEPIDVSYSELDKNIGCANSPPFSAADRSQSLLESTEKHIPALKHNEGQSDGHPNSGTTASQQIGSHISNVIAVQSSLLSNSSSNIDLEPKAISDKAKNPQNVPISQQANEVTLTTPESLPPPNMEGVDQSVTYTSIFNLMGSANITPSFVKQDVSSSSSTYAFSRVIVKESPKSRSEAYAVNSNLPSSIVGVMDMQSKLNGRNISQNTDVDELSVHSVVQENMEPIVTTKSTVIEDESDSINVETSSPLVVSCEADVKIDDKSCGDKAKKNVSISPPQSQMVTLGDSTGLVNKQDCLQGQSFMKHQSAKKTTKTTITLTGKQLASLLDKSSGKKVLHIIPQRASPGKVASIKSGYVGGSINSGLAQQSGTDQITDQKKPAKQVKVIQLKPSQIQQVKPGVYTFKLQQGMTTPANKSTESSLTAIKEEKVFTSTTLKGEDSKSFVLGNPLEAYKTINRHGDVSHQGQKTKQDTPGECKDCIVTSYHQSTGNVTVSQKQEWSRGDSASISLEATNLSSSSTHHHTPSDHRFQTTPKSLGVRNTGKKQEVIDLTCSEAKSFDFGSNLFDKFRTGHDSDDSSQDSQLDENMLIRHSLSSAAHRSSATRSVLKKPSTREELYRDIQQHLRHHVTEQPANSGGSIKYKRTESYTISDTDSSDGSLCPPDKMIGGLIRKRINKNLAGGKHHMDVVINRTRYDHLVQAGSNVSLNLSSSEHKQGHLAAHDAQLSKRKRGRPRKVEQLHSKNYIQEIPKTRRLPKGKNQKKRKANEGYMSRFENEKLPDHLKTKAKKLNTQENIIDLTKKQNTVVISENTFELAEEISDKVARNLTRKGWACTLCGKSCNVGNLDALFGPYKIKVNTEQRENNELDSEKEYPVGKHHDVWLHRDCGIWAPNVCLVGTQLRGIATALEEAGQIKCSLCNQYGASLACMSRVCGERYHFICAKQTGCLFKESNLSILCSKHKHSIVV